MDGVINGGVSMMNSMGWGGLLGIALLVLGVAALLKYLLFDTKS